MSNKYIGHSGGLIGPVIMEKPEDKTELSFELSAYYQHIAALSTNPLPCEGWKPEEGREYTLGIHFLLINMLTGKEYYNHGEIGYAPNGLLAIPLPAAPQDMAIFDAVTFSGGGEESYFRQLNDEFSKWWMDIAVYSGKPPLVIQVAYWWNNKMQSPAPVRGEMYPAEFVEWVFYNCILLEGSWYMWKKGPGSERPGGVKFTLAELFAGPYQTHLNNTTHE